MVFSAIASTASFTAPRGRGMVLVTGCSVTDSSRTRDVLIAIPTRVALHAGDVIAAGAHWPFQPPVIQPYLLTANEAVTPRLSSDLSVTIELLQRSSEVADAQRIWPLQALLQEGFDGSSAHTGLPG
jgi:hypothetical protein